MTEHEEKMKENAKIMKAQSGVCKSPIWIYCCDCILFTIAPHCRGWATPEKRLQKLKEIYPDLFEQPTAPQTPSRVGEYQTADDIQRYFSDDHSNGGA